MASTDEICQKARDDFIRLADFDYPPGWRFEDLFHTYDGFGYLTLEEVAAFTSKGEELLEVFSVVIRNEDQKNPHFLYGTIAIQHGPMRPVHIFIREREDPVSIMPGSSSSLLLNLPSKGIRALDPLVIQVDLMDKDSDEVISGWISCNPITGDPEFEEPLSQGIQRIVDEHGNRLPMFVNDEDDLVGNFSVKVNYAMFGNAVPATVEVTLIKHGASTKVHGLITAQIGCFQEEDFESVLFDQGKGEDVMEVNSKKVIPLSRSVVTMPLESSLIVLTDLYDGDAQEIARGNANFPVESFGIFQKNISGKYGEIRVKVTWKLYPICS